MAAAFAPLAVSRHRPAAGNSEPPHHGLAANDRGRESAKSLFAWVPQWAVLDMASGFEGISRNTLLTIWILGLVSATLLGGATQELFARGFLLPRTAHLGHGAPVLNAAAFAVLHLVSPWSWPVFFLVSLPWAFAVFRTRSIQLGLVGHVGMLVIMWLGMTAMLFRA